MYQVLYRKWRPQVFSDVVGQPHVTSTLKNEIEQGRHSHAYLFTGSRGTGKTTCAKILAKAVNCLNQKNGDPCNECEICRGIDNGSILDVIEIDAASNNGVDNIRDIRQEANFTPAACKYRVYIIDEVHMLSAGAFNALLKTLEEPPEHVKFILATTEVHKLPATILSRCQRFDFRRIPAEDMLERMNFIASQEGMVLDREAGMLIARIADGGMRDALSLLDQCAGRDKNVTAELVSRVAGLTSRDYLFRLADALNSSDCSGAMSILDELHNSSCDMERLCSELINHYRSLMIAKTVKKAADILVCTGEEFEQIKKQSESYTLEKILYAAEIFQNTTANMKKGVNKRIEMETAVIKLTNPTLSADNSAILARLASIEETLRNGQVTLQAMPSEPAEKTDEKKENPKSEQTNTSVLGENNITIPEKKEASEDTPPVGDEAFLKWPEVIEEIKKTNMPLWGVLDSSSAYIHGDFVLVDCRYPTFGAFIRQGSNAADVKKAIYSVTGKRYRLGIYKRKEEETSNESKDPLDNLLDKMRRANITVKETE